MIIIYFLFVGTMFSTSWLMEKKIFTEYSLNNITQLMSNKLSNAEVIAIEYIPRTKNIYFITDTKQFYAIEFGTMKEVYHASLEFLNHPIDMKSSELSSIFLVEKEGEKEIVIVDIDGWGDQIPKAYPPYKIDGNMNGIVMKGLNYSFIFSDKLNHLKAYTLKRANVPFVFLDQLPENLRKKIGGFKDIEPYWNQANLTKISQIIDAYDADKIEFSENYGFDMISINNKRITYENIHGLFSDNINSILGEYRFHTIDNSMKVKDIILKTNDQNIAEKAVFISGKDHKLYYADITHSNTFKVVSSLYKLSRFISTLPFLPLLGKQ